MTRQVMHNRERHDEIADIYDSIHPEIYNVTEQKRLEDALTFAASAVECSKNGQFLALDFGSGTGNLTRHLLKLGAEVTAADVSSVSLEKLLRKFPSGKQVATCLLDEKGLRNIPDETFDLTATYSVLHHIPDYVDAVAELVRVTKPGGVVFIDHEVCPDYWEFDAEYLKYLKELDKQLACHHLKEIGQNPPFQLKMSAFINNITNLLISPRRWKKIFRKICLGGIPEDYGDIHVTREDHIDWDLIRAELSKNCQILSIEDYLLCREKSATPPVWNKWKEFCSDMRLVVAKKLPDPAA